MGRLYVMLRHDFSGLGKRGQIVSKEDFDAFVRAQIDAVESFRGEIPKVPDHIKWDRVRPTTLISPRGLAAEEEI